MGIRMADVVPPMAVMIDTGANNPVHASPPTPLPTVSGKPQLHFYLRYVYHCDNSRLDSNGICRYCIHIHGADPVHTEVDNLRDPNDAEQHPMFQYSIDTHQLHIRDYEFGSMGYCPVAITPHFVRRSTRLTVAGVKK